MSNANATYRYLNSSEVLVTVEYPNGGFGIERVAKPRNGSRYESAYNAASIKASIQGLTLASFRKED